MKIPGFLPIAAGIVLAFAGGAGLAYGHVAAGLAAIGGGLALAVSRFAKVGRKREAEDAQLQLDLQAGAAGVDNPEIDEGWAHKEFGGHGT